MRAGTTRRNTAVLAAAAVLGCGACLGMAAADALPRLVRLALIAAVACLVAVDVVLYSSRRLPRWLVGATLVGMALANGTLPIASAMNVGRFVAPLLLFVAVVRLGAWRDPSARTRRVLVAAGVGLLVVSASTLTSLDPGFTLQKAFAFATVVAGVVAAVRWSRTRAPELAQAVLGAFALLVVTNAAMVVIGGDVYSTDHRFRGWTINPNNLAILCAFAIPVLASEALTRHGSRRVLAGAGLALAGLLLLMTGSRASSLGALLGAAAVLRISGAARSLAFVGSSLALLVLAPLAVRSASNANLLTSVERQGTSGREQVWPLAVHEAERKPFTGAGFSTTEHRFLAGEFGDFSVFRGAQFHNSYLEAAVELGIPAAALLVGVGLFALSHMVRQVPVERAWAAGMAVSGAVIGVFETGLLTPGSVLMFPFWLAVGVLAVQAVKHPPPVARPVGLVAAVGPR